MTLQAKDLENKIAESIVGAKVVAKDLTGGGDHWQVRVSSAEFRGKSLVAQHQMIYRALGTWMHKEIHALAIEVSDA